MSLKVSNIIAIELALLIGIMSWMASFLYSRFPSAEPITAAEIQESTADVVATIAPVREPTRPRSYAADYRAYPERAGSVGEQLAPTAQDYDEDYQEIATEPYASSGLQDDPIVEASPSYAEPIQEPAVVQPDYVASPQIVAYQQPAQIVVYQEPAQIVVFSNHRRFANRFRSRPHSGAFMTATHRSPDRIGPHQNVRRVVPRRNPNAPTCRPTEGLRPGGIVRQNSGRQGSRSFSRR